MARITQNFIVVGDEIYLYYGGVQGPHTGKKFKSVERRTQPMLGLATIRRDGFVSVEAGAEEGVLLTKPMEMGGEELHVNADSRGELIVEVTDEEGVTLEGYTSHSLAEDRTDVVVGFDRPLGGLAGQTMRLRFRMREANLYSYWFI